MNQSEYSSGFAPTYEFNEYEWADEFMQLGDRNEFLLSLAFEKMGVVTARSGKLKSKFPAQIQHQKSSLERKNDDLIIGK